MLEEGKPQAVKGFEEHTGGVAAAGAHAPELPPNTFSNLPDTASTGPTTVILLDGSYANASTQPYVRDQLSAYFRTMPIGTGIAIFFMDTELHLVQGFTSDRETLVAALRSKIFSEAVVRPAGRNAAFTGHRHDMIRADMKLIGKYLAGFPGRKNLIWFTGAVPHAPVVEGDSNPFEDDPNFTGNTSQLAEMLTLSRVAVYPIDERGLAGNAGSNAGMGRTSAGASRDPAVAPTTGSIVANAKENLALDPHFQHMYLETLAHDTGGEALYNSNGFKDAVSNIVEGGSNYYTISYSPKDSVWNGNYRHINIQVDDSHVKLHYRPGYFARNYQVQARKKIAALEGVSAPDAEAEEEPAEASKEAVEASVAAKDAGEPTEATKEVAKPDSSPHHRRDPAMALKDVLGLGALPDTELVFYTHIVASPEKLAKNVAPPADNHLAPAFQKETLRNYEIIFATDVHKLRLIDSGDGVRHGKLECGVVLYDDQGRVVNAVIAGVPLKFDDETYRRALQHGFGTKLTIAVPESGHYFLRIGELDPVGDRVGSMEIPVSRVQVAVASAVAARP